MSRKNRAMWLLGIVLLGLLLRGWAVLRLPLDFDEPIYLETGADYARLLEAGDWGGVIDYRENQEHPPLVKLLYGAVILLVGEDTEGTVTLYAGRTLSAALGGLATLAMALFSPLAGGLLAAHTLTVKYTSQAYLEALPHLASLATVLLFVRSQSGRDRWFWLSAAALGVTAAGKFAYAPVLIVIVYLALWDKHTHWRDLLLYLLVTAAVFWLLNPSLWRDPFGRLLDSVFFHLRYSQGEHVQQVAYPWYQPLYWISRSPPSTWHPDVFFYFGVDGPIFLLALVGLYWEWRQRRWVVVWIVGCLLFLLIWPTKWPQYTLVLVPALCLAASTTLKRVYHWVQKQETYWTWFTTMFPAPPLAFWIIVAGLAVAIGVGYTAMTLEQAIGRLGWSHLTAENSLLPSNIVYDVAVGLEGELLFGTERGAMLWTPSSSDQPDGWVHFDAKNSGLPADQVLALLQEADGDYWFGTDGGVARYDGERWERYRGDELGLQGDTVYALAAGSDGRLWVAGSSGSAVYDGEGWTAYQEEFDRGRVLSLVVDPQAASDEVWFGTEDRIVRLDTGRDEWTVFTEEVLDADWGGVVDLTVDAAGTVWAGTLGAGLGRWDGIVWHFFRTGNSDLPFNTVNTVAEVEPGLLWVGTALPNAAGGVLAEFDGEDWRVLSDRNSGFSESEPLAMVVDESGRRWIGTRAAGVDAYQPQR